MDPKRDRHRRAFLGGMGALMAGLAGCTTGSTISTDDNSTAPGTATPPTDSRTPAPEPTPTDTPIEPPSGENVDDWTGIERGSVVDSFDALGRWRIDAGSAAVSTDVNYDGGQSVYLDTNGDQRVRIRRVFDSAQDFQGKDFSIAVRLKGTSKHLLQPRIRLRDLFGNDRVLSGSVYPEATGRWLRLDLGVAKDQGAQMDAVKEIWVDHWAGDAESRFYVDDLRAHDGPGKGYVMFTFDDAHAMDYTVAYPTLERHGYAGACFPTIGDVSQDSHPSTDEYLEMQADGWDIGGHTLNHSDLTERTRREQALILERNKELLAEHGFTHGARFFRTPFSNYDTNSLDLMPAFFEASIVGAGSATGTNLESTDLRTIAFREGDDYEQAKRLIDAAVEYDQLLGLTFHMNKMGSRAAFESVVAHAADYERRGKLGIITPSTLLDEHLRG